MFFEVEIGAAEVLAGEAAAQRDAALALAKSSSPLVSAWPSRVTMLTTPTNASLP